MSGLNTYMDCVLHTTMIFPHMFQWFYHHCAIILIRVGIIQLQHSFYLFQRETPYCAYCLHTTGFKYAGCLTYGMKEPSKEP